MILGLGLDLVEISRFRDLLARHHGAAARLFTPSELAESTSPGGRRRTEALAARFAAKEAASKVLGTGPLAIGFHSVEVRRSWGGAPELTVTGSAGELAGARGITRWSVSLTHTSATAGAVVIGEGDPPTRGSSGESHGVV